MTPDSTGKKKSTMILGGLSALVDTSVTVRLQPASPKLVAAADEAMYAAKTGGRNRTSRYEPASGQAAVQE